MLRITLCLLIANAIASPVFQRCFQGGQLILERRSATSMSEFCLKDDVSMIKSVIDYDRSNNSIIGNNKVYRQWIVSDWKLCHPIKAEGGSINVIEVEKDLTIRSNTYICTTDCTITVDKENAQLIFQTSKLNHFEVTGTTLSTGWFKTKASVTLDQTCEHIKVSCGKKSIQFHACFRQHMTCIRFLHRSILPGSMANSICQNIELIIILTLTSLIFIILNIIAKTYICYLMLPIFIPIAYAYGWVYNKSCKKCVNCGLAYHPFSNCGSHCVCGSVFQTSDRMRMHRESGLCSGFKSLRVARILCKAKTSSLVVAVLSSLLILSFVTPIEGADDDIKYSLSDLPDAYTKELDMLNKKIDLNLIISITNMSITILLLVLAISSHLITNKIAKCKVFLCHECDMYHTYKGIRYNGDFSNKCGSCTCGTLEDPNYTTMHKASELCISEIKRLIQKKIMIVLVIFVLIENSVCLATAEEKCFKEHDYSIDCIGPLLTMRPCSKSTIESVASKLITEKQIAKEDAEKLKLLPDSIKQAWDMIDNQPNYDQMFLMEYAFLKRECSYFEEFEHNSGINQIVWRTIAKTEHFDICAIRSNQQFCKCMSKSVYCKDANWDIASEMNDTYSFKPLFYQHDIQLYTKIFKAAFKGTSSRTYDSLMSSRNKTGMISLVKKLEKRFPYNNLLMGFLKFGQVLFNLDSFDSLPKGKTSRTTITSQRTNYENLSNAKSGTITKECKNLKLLQCISPRYQVFVGHVIKCGDSEIGIYDFQTPVYKKSTDESMWCTYDKHCFHNGVGIDAKRLELLKKLNCWYTDPTEMVDVYTKPRKSCRMINKGNCVIAGTSLNVMQCDDNQIFYTDHRSSADTQGDIGEYCLAQNCDVDRFPINTDVNTTCIWEYNTIKPKYVTKTELRTLEEYKRALQDKLSHSLEVYHFQPTSNFPHIKPSYKYITANGIETTDGIEGAYITVDIPALSGTSVGLTVLSKDDISLMDVIIYVKAATIKSIYNHIYDTGPTININVKHDELCTGPCPNAIPHDPQWLTFSQERTSRWGCEEFGCLAVGEGCVFGSCQDVIKREMRVYKKTIEEVNEITLCIIFQTNTFCQTINALEPMISPFLEVQLEGLDTRILPSVLALQNHKLYSGQINDLGSFGLSCGNVQQVNKTIYGAGQPKFDYLCHGAKRKDIIVRKCYNNNYGSCKLLNEEANLILEDNYNTITVVDNKHMIGTVKSKLVLGDIKYKLFNKKPEFELEAHCVGCVNCFSNFNCELKIESTTDITCPIAGPCEFFHNNIFIQVEHTKYAMKMICKKKPDQTTEFTICGKKFFFNIDTVDKHENIEIDVGDQTSYIVEKDNRCKTWLCRVVEEGFSVIFEPLQLLFGNYFHMAIVIIIGLIALAIIIYILLPMFMKLKDTLKANEIAYQREMKLK
ncbi:polyprotein [Sororoca virus]|uniref:Envelopment polyprotein n=1 Tax=Sororoca virus TaxID=273354 RepID=H6U331_9VIRU|nr:polyprotein [Sororoca virus]AEZ35265.1 polyprotein [Sororoca virus]